MKHNDSAKQDFELIELSTHSVEDLATLFRQIVEESKSSLPAEFVFAETENHDAIH